MTTRTGRHAIKRCPCGCGAMIVNGKYVLKPRPPKYRKRKPT